ncbi:hypothetical protein [Rhodococcus jostii]
MTRRLLAWLPVAWVGAVAVVDDRAVDDVVVAVRLSLFLVWLRE